LDSAEAVGCYGNPIVKTPNLDALGKKRSVMFSSAYCQGAVSNPSRASLVTGLRPETTGVFGNADDTDEFITAEHPNIAKSLKQNGAWTAQTGKLMHKWFHSFNIINHFDQIEMEKPFFNENGVVVDLEPKRGPFKGVTKYKSIIPDFLPAGEMRDWRWVPDKKHDAMLQKLQHQRDSILATGVPSTWEIRAPFQQYHAEMLGDMGIRGKI
jgi:arylsulfatase A-like enzyme